MFPHAFTTFSLPRATLPDLLSTAQSLGYRSLEPRTESNHAHGIELTLAPAARRDVARQLAATGLSLCCLSTSCRLALPADNAAQLDAARRHIDLAHDVGAPLLRVFAGVYPPDVSRDRATETLVASLRSLAPHADAARVTVCLETHDVWADPAVVAGVMRAIDHPAVGLVWDPLHTYRSARAPMDLAYRALHPWIRHVHVHDALLDPDPIVMVPLGTGQIPHRPVLRLLRDGAYPGHLSGEWLQGMMSPDFFADHLAGERRTLLAYEAELASDAGPNTTHSNGSSSFTSPSDRRSPQ